MRILQLHCDSIEYTPTKKEIKSLKPNTYEYLAKVSAMRKQKELTWNGHIPDACLPTSHDGVQRVRVTDLESLSKCPYRFYADCHVEWKPLQRLVFADQMSSLDWGNLVHDFLEFLITPHHLIVSEDVADRVSRCYGEFIIDQIQRSASLNCRWRRVAIDE